MGLPKIAVVGGGWAGISAAVTLTTQGLPVTLFEAGRSLGGRAKAVSLNGRIVDNGQHILLGAYHTTLNLMKQVGVDVENVLSRLPLQIQDETGFRLRLPPWPSPLHLLWGLLTCRGTSVSEKLRTARWMHSLQSREFALEDDRTVSTWLHDQGQTGTLCQHLWLPLCLAAMNTPPEHASAKVFLHVLADSLGSQQSGDTDLLIPRATLSDLLPDPALRWLEQHGAEIHLQHRVKALETGRVDGQPFDAIVLATAPQHALPLLFPASAQGAEDLISYQPIATLYLQYPPEYLLPFPLFSRRDGPIHWFVDRGEGFMAGTLSGKGDWENLSDTELLAAAEKQLGFPSPPLWQGVIREKRATFTCHPGLNRPPARTHLPNIWQAGDITWEDYPATLEGAVRSGRRAAQQILETLECGEIT